jgi:predicted  nucleic acid-binding Zn-ribbon protein
MVVDHNVDSQPNMEPANDPFSSKERFFAWALQVGTNQALSTMWEKFVEPRNTEEAASVPAAKTIAPPHERVENSAALIGDLQRKIEQLQTQIASQEQCLKAIVDHIDEIAGPSVEDTAALHARISSIIKEHSRNTVYVPSTPQLPGAVATPARTPALLAGHDQATPQAEQHEDVAQLQAALRAAKKEIKELRRLGVALHNELRDATHKLANNAGSKPISSS